MLRSFILLAFFSINSIIIKAQEKEKIHVISRAVEGEIRTLFNDTLYGNIKVLGAKDYYITSIEFKQKGKKKEVYSAEDIKRFKQIVPYPDRPEFGVEEVYFESKEDPDNPYRKFFFPIEAWK